MADTFWGDIERSCLWRYRSVSYCNPRGQAWLTFATQTFSIHIEKHNFYSLTYIYYKPEYSAKYYEIVDNQIKCL